MLTTEDCPQHSFCAHYALISLHLIQKRVMAWHTHEHKCMETLDTLHGHEWNLLLSESFTNTHVKYQESPCMSVHSHRQCC